MEKEAPETEGEVVRRAERLLADRLPPRWSSQLVVDHGSRTRVDAMIELVAPDGSSITLVVEAKRVLESRDVAIVREQLQQLIGSHREQGLVAARYLSPPVRARLAEAGLSYVDATGNVRVSVESPALFVSDRGADRDPWRGPGRPRGTLKGSPAARIVRAVVDLREPWTVRQLVELARVSTGAGYRVVEYLEREGLAERDRSGLIVRVDWANVLRRWSADFGFTRSNQISRWIAPRGLPDLMDRLARIPGKPRYAVTGTLAADEWAGYAPARNAMVYTEDASALAHLCDLRPAEAGSNVLLAEPEIDVVFDRTLHNRNGVNIAAPAQVVVDLMTGPGRSPSEAEELLSWMSINEGSWRG